MSYKPTLKPHGGVQSRGSYVDSIWGQVGKDQDFVSVAVTTIGATYEDIGSEITIELGSNVMQVAMDIDPQNSTAFTFRVLLGYASGVLTDYEQMYQSDAQNIIYREHKIANATILTALGNRAILLVPVQGYLYCKIQAKFTTGVAPNVAGGIDAGIARFFN